MQQIVMIVSELDMTSDAVHWEDWLWVTLVWIEKGKEDKGFLRSMQLARAFDYYIMLDLKQNQMFPLFLGLIGLLAK